MGGHNEVAETGTALLLKRKARQVACSHRSHDVAFLYSKLGQVGPLQQ